MFCTTDFIDWLWVQYSADSFFALIVDSEVLEMQ